MNARGGAPVRFGISSEAVKSALTDSPVLWAEMMVAQWKAGLLAPSRVARGTSTSTNGGPYAEAAERAIRKSENESRLRGLMRAVRILSGSKQPAHEVAREQMGKFLAATWGLRSAAEAAGGADKELVKECREKWGDAQLPPVDALVGSSRADALIVEHVLRRLT